MTRVQRRKKKQIQFIAARFFIAWRQPWRDPMHYDPHIMSIADAKSVLVSTSYNVQHGDLSTDKLLVAALRYAQSILAEHIAAGLCRKLHSTDSLDEAAAQLGRTALIILGMQIESMDMDTAPEEK
jgi:hypothetical protein